MAEDINQINQIAIFRGKTIRKTIFRKEWWFSFLDIIRILTDSPQPKTYWAKMKDREKNIFQPFPFWEQLKILDRDKDMYQLFPIWVQLKLLALDRK